MTEQDRERQTYEPDGYAGGSAEGSAGFLHDFNRPNVVECLVREGWHSKEVRIPEDSGGQDNIENLQLLCAHCNRVKGNRPQEYLMARLQEMGIVS